MDIEEVELLSEYMISGITEGRTRVTFQVPSAETFGYICNRFSEVLSYEQTLIEDIYNNIVIVGDLHGNIDDLLCIIQAKGFPSETQHYLFLGDYVDRGNNSIETILYLMCLKILYPDYVHLIRGNHEFIDICSHYGFYDECIERVPDNEGETVFKYITDTFPYIPLAAVVQDSYLAVHGGISSSINSLDDIRSIKREEIVDCNQNKIVCDLVWGDPRKLPAGVLTTFSERRW